MIKLHIWTDGDEEFGSFGRRATVEIEADLKDEDIGIFSDPSQNRMYIRGRLEDAFEQIFNDMVHVAFDDELKEEPRYPMSWDR